MKREGLWKRIGSFEESTATVRGIGHGGEERKVGRGTDEAGREAVVQSISVTHLY